MKAAFYAKYGPPEVLSVREVGKPVPGDNEILVKVHASTAAVGDWRIRKPDPFLARLFNGLFRPRRVNIPGLELSGEVEAAGKNVTRFRPGDGVFAFTGFDARANAEYRCLPEKTQKAEDGLVSLMPSTMSFDEAASLPLGGLTALGFMRKGGVKAGDRLLVYGASGSVGTFTVQLAKQLGAEVTGVCSTANLELVRSLGADHVIDYTKEDFTSGGRVYDLVFDAVGKLAASRGRRVLKPGGRYLSVMTSVKLETGDLDRLKELAETGGLRSVIDRCYTLDQIVEAHRYVEGGHKKGNVVIRVDSTGD